MLYLDRLVGQHVRDAHKMLKVHGWGVPGLSWDPAAAPLPD
jgi:peptide deformylase